jgi:hypothetical protein
MIDFEPMARRMLPNGGRSEQSLSKVPGIECCMIHPVGFAMLPHGNNEILTKEEFCQRLLEAVHALEPLNRSWYAASAPLMQRSDKELLEAIFNARNNLSVLEIAIENGNHDDYFARAAKIEADNVSRFHAVSGA